MKKTLSVLMLLVAIGSTALALPTENPAPASGVGIMKKGKTFHVFYKAAKLSDVKIFIRNERNDLVFAETIRKTDGFVRPYNFTQLEDGEYTVEVIDCTHRQVQKITHGLKPSDKLAHVVRVSPTENKFLLTLPNKVHNIISVKIYGYKHQLVYEELLEITDDFAKLYNLNQINDEFSFEITDEEGNVKVLSY
ncbi:hypothetical protein ACFQ21_06730 [Ohtaekwangia kribbensis]|jgi:hypothetical protein|uniref:DUF4397 domain-containing protein n=1 Tax=Ohtaekwangia kribbensis TaxID=688913 RepID=A0ABW3JYE8_9BACT